MRIECPKCATVLEVADDQVEKKGRCSSCKTKFLIPANSKDEIKIIDEKGGVKESKNLLAATKKMKADGLSASKTDDEKVTVNKKKEDETVVEASSLAKESSDDVASKEEEKDRTFDAVKVLGLISIGVILGLVVGFVLGQMTAVETDNFDNDVPKIKSRGDTSDPFGIESK